MKKSMETPLLDIWPVPVYCEIEEKVIIAEAWVK